MYTAIESPEGNLLIQTQQYITGLYVIMYETDNTWHMQGKYQQEALGIPEALYHKKIRAKALNKGHKINEENSTVL
jgi:hypothetical protein